MFLPITNWAGLYTVITTGGVNTFLFTRAHIIKEALVNVVTLRIVLLITIPAGTNICTESVQTSLN